MGFFDLFRRKHRDEDPEPEKTAPQSGQEAPAEPAPSVPEPEERRHPVPEPAPQKPDRESNAGTGLEAYLRELKKAAETCIPSQLNPSALPLVFGMIDSILSAESVRSKMEQGSWANATCAFERSEHNAESVLMDAFAETGYETDLFLSGVSEKKLAGTIRQSDDQTLLRAFGAADFYCGMLKEEYSARLRKLREQIAREMKARGNTLIVSRVLPVFEILQNECAEAVRINPDSEAARTLKRKLGEAITKQECIYVAYDGDFSDQFPFIGTDGRMEICSRQDIALRLQNYYSTEHLGHITMRKIERAEIPDTFRQYINSGISVFRLDNGVTPVDIWFHDFLPRENAALLDEQNRSMRALFLRQLQYGSRIRNMDAVLKKTPYERRIQELMLTVRYQAYRELSNGLVYVLAASACEPGVTCYTPKALERAKAMLTDPTRTDTLLIAPGHASYGVYDRALELRGIRNPGGETEGAWMLAFTCRHTAGQVQNALAARGVDTCVVIATFDELRAQLVADTGVLLDAPEYGLVLAKEEFQEIVKWRYFSGNILVDLQENLEESLLPESRILTPETLAELTFNAEEQMNGT